MGIRSDERPGSPVTIAIADEFAASYEERLAPMFPDLRFLVAKSVPEMLGRAAEMRLAQVLITTGIGIPPGAFDELPGLRWVHALIAGVDRFVGPLSNRPDIVLTSSRGIHGPQVAEMAITQMLVLARDVTRMIRNRDDRIWEPWMPMTLDKRTVGVVGLGISGEAIGRACKTFGMHVIGVSHHARALQGFDEIRGYESLGDVANQVDFLVLAVPLTSETHHLIGEQILARMKPSAYLVNIARGGIVDEDALVSALKTGVIAGAALDVFESEPLPAESVFWTLPNVFISPHLGGRTDDYTERALTVLLPNLRHFLADESGGMLNIIDRRSTGGIG